MCCFFFNDTATTEIYTLSLHDALPIYQGALGLVVNRPIDMTLQALFERLSLTLRNAYLAHAPDRKSTRLNSSHSQISYAVFCLKKKKNAEYTLIVAF